MEIESETKEGEAKYGVENKLSVSLHWRWKTEMGMFYVTAGEYARGRRMAEC